MHRGAPPPTSRDYFNLERGSAVVDGPDGRLSLDARMDAVPASGDSYIALGAGLGESPRITLSSGAVDLDTIESGDDITVSVYYNVRGAEGGYGNLHVNNRNDGSIEGVFSGCVRSENSVFPINGPYRLVRGGFHATRS